MKQSSKFLLIIICLILKTDVLAVEVDVYQNMESGNPGDSLTAEIMDFSSHGGCGEVTTT